MTPTPPPDFKETILQILTNQQDLMKRITEQMEKQGGNQGSELVLDSLASNITEFEYDLEKELVRGLVFPVCRSVYGGCMQAGRRRKVRLLLRKLSPAAHERYTSFILPELPKKFNFDDTVAKLKSIFGSPVSPFHRRYQCLQTVKEEGEDYVAYSCKVNRACVEFKLKDLKEDQFKCLIFVCGLTSPKDADIRMRLLSKINETADITLEKIVEDCKSIINLKKDTGLIGGQSTSTVATASTQAVRTSSPHGKFRKKERTGGKSDVPNAPCWSCGGMHYNSQCSFKDHKCRDCGRTGHKEGYCSCFASKSRSKPFKGKQQHVKNHASKIVTVKNLKRSYVETAINGVPVDLQLDSGSDITIISRQNWVNVGSPPTSPPDCNVQTASGDKLGIEAMLRLDGRVRALGRTLFVVLQAGRNSNTGSASGRAENQVPEVFNDRLGLCTKTQVRLVLKPDVQPVFRPKRPVSYNMEAVVEDELQRLENLGIIKPVSYSDWAAPIVVVRKPDRSVRICADYSTGLNNALESNNYPLPLPEDIFNQMSGCTMFSHIDLLDAYLQVEVDEDSRKLVTINTHLGLYRYNRLSPGVKSAPGAFQQIMGTMLGGVPCTAPYLDDILVGGRTAEEHKENLYRVLERLKQYGFTVKLEKCRFFMRQVKYLGQLLDTEGIRPDPDKVKAIVNMPPPHDVPTLRSYLGAVNYYGKYIREMRTLRQPLDELLKESASFQWSDACQRSFDRFKEILQSPLMLTHYNPRLEMVVSADASNVGIGARIAYRFPDGSEKAIYHASRSLTPAESRYSQIEKEALGLVYAATKFHRMIYGRHFVLQTDHKPLLAIFGSKRGIPPYTANRLQRWALTMLLYDFRIEHISTDHFGHADILSRLINSHIKPDEDYVIASIEVETVICNVVCQSIEHLPVSYHTIAAETSQDRTLQKVVEFVDKGWPSDAKSLSGTPEVQQFFARRDSLYLAQKVLMYSDRIVIPKKLQKKVLEQLHRGHPGIDRMRSLARTLVYWPNIDDQISALVRACQECASVAKADTKTKLQSWPTPEKPWQRVHADFAGPINDTYFLLVVDSFSKWPEIIPTKRTTTAATISILRKIFARFGNPEVMVTDNGPQLTSDTFEQFCESNGIMHLKTAPFHPQSNGQAERFVDTFKRTVKKIRAGGEDLDEALDIFLNCYRSTPCRNAPGGKSPAEILLGRPMRTSLELLRPPSKFTKDNNNKQDQQFNAKHGAKEKSFVVRDKVYAQVHQGNNWSWVAGEVIECVGRVMYNVWLPERQRLIRSHSNQLRPRYDDCDGVPDQAEQTIPLDILLGAWGLKPSGDSTTTEAAPPPPPAEPEGLSDLQREFLRELFRTTNTNRRPRPARPGPEVPLRRSSRSRVTPVRYEPYQLY
ncbi:uncharacterized protein K02A2.6-like [Culex quinquefasciatus]|uniref:uncharacterized protein K02A2.6-like n=1 Tax=Culex quinquefasciatus TaxID=7176 RepID=UPI0018E3A8DB|nr:uncharacterized protein K02A2.6-like [Culex quinquefasciatus]